MPTAYREAYHGECEHVQALPQPCGCEYCPECEEVILYCKTVNCENDKMWGTPEPDDWEPDAIPF